MREKAERKLAKQKAKEMQRQGSYPLLERVAPRVAKRIEEMNQRRFQRIESEYENLTEEERRSRGRHQFLFYFLLWTIY